MSGLQELRSPARGSGRHARADGGPGVTQGFDQALAFLQHAVIVAHVGQRQARAHVGVDVAQVGSEFAAGLEGLAEFERIWCLFVFHLNHGYGLKVRSPREPGRARGLFATRAPHRPAPIGLSCLRVTALEGREIHVLGLDILDGTPVLDIKPYVPYADAFPEARAGWLEGRVPDEPDEFRPR